MACSVQQWDGMRRKECARRTVGPAVVVNYFEHDSHTITSALISLSLRVFPAPSESPIHPDRSYLCRLSGWLYFAMWLKFLPINTSQLLRSTQLTQIAVESTPGQRPAAKLPEHRNIPISIRLQTNDQWKWPMTNRNDQWPMEMTNDQWKWPILIKTLWIHRHWQKKYFRSRSGP